MTTQASVIDAVAYAIGSTSWLVFNVAKPSGLVELKKNPARVRTGAGTVSGILAVGCALDVGYCLMKGNPVAAAVMAGGAALNLGMMRMAVDAFATANETANHIAAIQPL